MNSEYESGGVRREDIFGMEQKIIDPATGLDITGDALTGSRREYEEELERVIDGARNRVAEGIPRLEVWKETEDRIRELQQRLWDAHKGGWLQDWLESRDGEDRFIRDLKRARKELGLDEFQS